MITLSKIQIEMLNHCLIQHNYQDRNEVVIVNSNRVNFKNNDTFYLHWNKDLVMWQLEEN